MHVARKTIRISPRFCWRQGKLTSWLKTTLRFMKSLKISRFLYPRVWSRLTLTIHYLVSFQQCMQRRIWTTSLFRLRSISSVPLSMQSGHILKSYIEPSWKISLHGYTTLTMSPQQSQNKGFTFLTFLSLKWG